VTAKIGSQPGRRLLANSSPRRGQSVRDGAGSRRRGRVRLHLLPGAAVAHDFGGHAGHDGEVGHVAGDHGARADHGAPADGDAFHDAHPSPQPYVVADGQRSARIGGLIEDGRGGLVGAAQGDAVTRPAEVALRAGDEVVADLDAVGGLDLAVGADLGTLADVQRTAFGLHNGKAADQ